MRNVPPPPLQPDVAGAAALLADRSRVAMLLVLGDGRALPAGELARAARVGAASASAHLARLCAAGLVEVRAQGRHRYYRLASPHVADAVESLAALAHVAPPAAERPRVPPELRAARLCYGHLAGAVGVAIARALVDRGFLSSLDDGCAITQRGRAWAAEVGLALSAGGAPAVKLCLVDWSERRPHVAGALGRALAARMTERGYLVHVRGSRAVRLTERGRCWLREQLGVETRGADAPSPGART